MIVHQAVPGGEVVDTWCRPVEHFAIAEGAALVDVGRTDQLSAIVYLLADGATDPQPVHHQDEVYVVLSGRAAAVVGDVTTDVGFGSVVIVAAGTPHQFVDPSDGFTAVAVFAPPLA